MDNCTIGICGDSHVPAHFHIVDCNVCEVVVEFNVYVGIMYVAGVNINLMF